MTDVVPLVTGWIVSLIYQCLCPHFKHVFLFLCVMKTSVASLIFPLSSSEQWMTFLFMFELLAKQMMMRQIGLFVDPEQIIG